MLEVRVIERAEWDELTARPENLREALEAENVFIVRGYVSPSVCKRVRLWCQSLARSTAASWYPLTNDCPDYHRIHDKYPNARVRSVQHGWYFHTWNQQFSEFQSLPGIQELFSLKQRLGSLPDDSFLTNRADVGPVARIVVHQYPRGGGGQEEHIDPTDGFALAQTVIQASVPGTDYADGGLFVRDSSGSAVILDPLSENGDLIVMSPGIRHGVAPIDPEALLDWSSNDGRWIIMPIILYSDHFADSVERPRGISK